MEFEDVSYSQVSYPIYILKHGENELYFKSLLQAVNYIKKQNLKLNEQMILTKAAVVEAEYIKLPFEWVGSIDPKKL